MIKAIIFDIDGVLIDSTIPGMNLIQSVAKQMQLKVPSKKLLRLHWGNTASTLFSLLAQDLNWPNNASENFLRNFMKRYYSIRYVPFENLAQTLNLLKEENIILSIISSRDQQTMHVRLVQVNINYEVFYIIQSREDWPYTKPNPRVFEFTINKLQQKNINPDEILYVGDTIKFDFAATQNHQPPLKFVGITSGAATKKEFIKAGLDEKFILKSAAKLPNILHYL